MRIFEKDFIGREMSEATAPLKGFVIPGWLAWVMVFAGIIIFLIGIPFFIYSLIIWGYFRVFDAKGIVMMIVGAVIFYIGYKNAGFILTREEVIDRWSALIENGRGKADNIFSDTEGFIKKSEVPRIAIERKEIAPTIAKDILGMLSSLPFG